MDFGLFAVDRHLMHPIFQWLDYRYEDYGAFARASDERSIGGFRNRLIVGVNLHNGKRRQPAVRQPARRGEGRVAVLLNRQVAERVSLCRELVLLLADRRARRRNAVPARGARPAGPVPDATAISPDAEPSIFGARKSACSGTSTRRGRSSPISRAARRSRASARIRSRPPRSPPSSAQTATTYEIGTRGRRPDFTWDVALYRANIRNELQCLTEPVDAGRLHGHQRQSHGASRHRGRVRRGGAAGARYAAGPRLDQRRLHGE